jgi:hypothetical protein
VEVLAATEGAVNFSPARDGAGHWGVVVSVQIPGAVVSLFYRAEVFHPVVHAAGEAERMARTGILVPPGAKIDGHPNGAG